MTMIDLDEKRLNRTILTLAWPAILENILQTFVFIIDSIFVGRLGTVAFAAVGQSSMVLFTVIFTFYGVGVATGAIVARRLGQSDADGASEAAAHGLFIGIALGAVLAAVGLAFGEQALVALGTEREVIEASLGYMDIVFSFSLVRLVLYIGAGILRAAGDTRTPLIATGIMNCFNVFGDWVLIFGIGPFPEMGIEGAAWATGLSYMIGASILMARLLRHREGFYIYGQHLRRFSLTLTKSIFRIAIPNIGEQAIFQGAYWAFLWIVTGLGTTALAAHFMAIRIEMFSFMPIYGLSMAVSAIVGQSLGAGKPDIAALTVQKAAMIGALAMAGLAIPFLTIPELLVSVFSPSPEVRDLAALCVRISALELISSALLMMYSAAMRGAGDTLSPMLISLFGAVFLRVGVIYLFTIEFGWGLAGVWWGTVIDWGLRAVVGYILFRHGRWKRISI
ncbi:MAG: MATE family efflux transporter [Candidatus Latescibacteria bacterium]|nr:MATE family efflux transporter [Candidatus Latescibacterota bacterium]